MSFIVLIKYNKNEQLKTLLYAIPFAIKDKTLYINLWRFYALIKSNH